MLLSVVNTCFQCYFFFKGTSYPLAVQYHGTSLDGISQAATTAKGFP